MGVLAVERSGLPVVAGAAPLTRLADSAAVGAEAATAVGVEAVAAVVAAGRRCCETTSAVQRARLA